MRRRVLDEAAGAGLAEAQDVFTFVLRGQSVVVKGEVRETSTGAASEIGARVELVVERGAQRCSSISVKLILACIKAPKNEDCAAPGRGERSDRCVSRTLAAGRRKRCALVVCLANNQAVNAPFTPASVVAHPRHSYGYGSVRA